MKVKDLKMLLGPLPDDAEVLVRYPYDQGNSRDRMMALLCESDDMKGERRHKGSDRGKPLAGKSFCRMLYW